MRAGVTAGHQGCWSGLAGGLGLVGWGDSPHDNPAGDHGAPICVVTGLIMLDLVPFGCGVQVLVRVAGGNG